MHIIFEHVHLYTQLYLIKSGVIHANTQKTFHYATDLPCMIFISDSNVGH